MSETVRADESSSKNIYGDPPKVNISLPEISELTQNSKRWKDVQLPIDILLLTVKDCEFLSCYYYINDPFRSYFKGLGHVYFGSIGDDQDVKLKVALMKCSEGRKVPGGTLTVVKNAVTQLRPKAVFSVGHCSGMNQESTKLGDVVLSEKLTTHSYQKVTKDGKEFCGFTTPVSRDIAELIKCAGHGWNPPLENPKERKVEVLCGEVLSGTEVVQAEWRREELVKSFPEAIAIETEGEGVFSAAHYLKMEWVVVKGISGYADGTESKENWQTFASVTAASLVVSILKECSIFEDWPHYKDISAEEESCRSDDPSENKRRRLAEPLNVKKCQEQLKSYYDTFSKVKIVPWDESSSIKIDEIYTPLNWVRDHRKPSGVTQEELEDYTDMFKEKHTRMLVYGRPGIGKTTFCKKAAYDWSKALKEILNNFSILLLIKLRDVCDLEDIRDVLRASKLLASDGPISVDSLYDYIINNQDKVLLILDGYDEYSFAEEHSPILAIWKGEQLRDCHVIVTTRQLKCDELRGPSHVQLEVQGFKSWEQIKTFARKFLVGEQDLDEFIHYIREKDLNYIVEIPLFLLMLCNLWKEKYQVELPKSRADIFTQFIQTILNHKGGSHQPMPFQEVTSTVAKEDLSNLGKVAFEALLQDRLYVRCSELPGNISRSFQKLSEVGLFQIVNLTSLNPEKGAYFIHKSVQEFLAARHINEEVLSIKGESTSSLSKVESFEKIAKMNEVLKFACELSTEAACAVFHHVGCVGRNEFLSKCDFMKLLRETVPPALSQNQELYLGLISHSYFCCSAEKRRDLYSVFPSYTGGVLSLDSNQLNITANEHLLKSGMIPDFIFFPPCEKSSVKSYRDLITVAEDTDAVFFSCSGEKKAADLLKNFPCRSLSEFFLKREGKIIVYVNQIWKEGRDTFPTEMLRELILPIAESTQVKRFGNTLNEQDNETASCLTKNTDSITVPTPQSLSCVTEIDVNDIERQEMKMLADCLPLSTALRSINIVGNSFEIIEIIDAQLTKSLVSRIIFTERLRMLVLVDINLTAKPAAAIARSLHQVPSLIGLNLSANPLGKGVSVLTQHLSRVPHEWLVLHDVKMTKQQVNDLSAAVRQSNISRLSTGYHDDKGNVKPEEEWPTDEYWREFWGESEEESDPGSVTDSGDEEEPGSVTDLSDEEDPGSVTDSGDEEDPGSVTNSGDKEEPGSCLET